MEDPNLLHARSNVTEIEGKPVPGVVLHLAHSHVLGAHLGVEKTRQRIGSRFHWPGVVRAIEDYCRTCVECQKMSPKPHFKNPLIPLPIIDVPFSRIAMDLVGPLVKSARGHQYILVILDYATRYPEAIPLRNMTTRVIARELLHLFSRVGIPKEILTDQGTPFMSKIMKDLCRLFKVKQLRTSVYHPQTDGLVERFNKTLKSMLKKVVDKDGRNWDQLLPYVLFSIREVPQASTGFSPFELLYGRQPRGLLDIAKEAWEEQPSPHRSLIEHVETMQTHMKDVWPMVREHMAQAQEAQRKVYNRGAQPREFLPGDKVLLLVPTTEHRFLASWQGPYEVVEKVGPVNYKVRQPGRRKPSQIYHVNLLKKWYAREALLCCGSPVVSPSSPDQEVAEVEYGPGLSKAQLQQTKELVQQTLDVFSLRPGRTTMVEHQIHTEPGQKVKMRPYRVPEARRAAIEQEVQKMLAMGVIEESHSEWTSPVILVPKPDKTNRFCNDFRKLNEISKFDAYPMPRIDELIDRLGEARYISTLDLTKGYWQVPLEAASREKTAFATPTGLYQYTVLPFGLHGAPATFQRLMDKVLRPHREYAAAYLDDVVIHSDSWDSHLIRLAAVLESLRRAGLTANPRKCKLGLEEAEYLGFTIGRGNVRPQERKVQAIQDWPRPSTKKQVKTFLGLTSYYCRFIPNFSTIASPLTDLTRDSQPLMVKWTGEAEHAFEGLKRALCARPVLVTPDFSRGMIVQTDASEVGIGAVLSQEVHGQCLLESVTEWQDGEITMGRLPSPD
ncbi:uncharacterized protein [Pseudochaenichthys georgianus]|uniref:uncharacterized protein n=1 Tax=Pseudochaenichthys georgianus TaxID=52239 RepID=UPI0039C0D25C